jgi:hypothetical protein
VPGVRRRLLDVGKKVSGVLAGPRDESPEPDGDEPVAPPETTPKEPDAVTSATTTETTTATSETEAPAPDALCAEAVEPARAAAVEVAEGRVGDHLGVEVEGERVVTHSFATTDPAYVGWRWAVTVARAEGQDRVTVDEVVLLPGSGALLAPEWVPWSERVQPGDLSPGDLLPPPDDDPRLVPSYADVDAERLPFDLHRELGLGRPRVLSLDGRADAAERWYEGPSGPDSPMAKAAPGRCADCGFLTPLAGALGRVFGACANGMAPDDGRVVALTHGCGAHSETRLETPQSSYAGMAVEDDEFEVVETPDSQAEADASASSPDEDPEAEAVTEAVTATADVPEDATVPGTEEPPPPLDDVVASTESP